MIGAVEDRGGSRSGGHRAGRARQEEFELGSEGCSKGVGVAAWGPETRRAPSALSRGGGPSTKVTAYTG